MDRLQGEGRKKKNVPLSQKKIDKSGNRRYDIYG